MTSSSDSPASGDPRITRGQSPQASVVRNPTASSRRQISGTFSTSVQWYWMFSRSVMSAVARAKSTEMRSAAAEMVPPSQRTRIMKYLASSFSMFSSPVQLPS